MDTLEYIVRTTGEYEAHESGKGSSYHRYFNRECNIGIGLWVLAGIIASTPLLVGTGVLVADILVRAVEGDHGHKAVSGIVGLTRDLYSKIK